MDQKSIKETYLDNAATTPVDERVLEEMVAVTREFYGNPSSIHTQGIKAREKLEQSRVIIAKILNCRPMEIVFTGGGSEADNLAIKGVAFKNRQKGNHIITSSFEHAAVKNAVAYLERAHGFKTTFLPVDREGLIDPSAVDSAITQETTLISIMMANNEIGTIQDVDEIGRICRENNVYFHTDAVQAFCKIPIDLEKTPIDLLAASAHKINGPKGVGMLFVRYGGHHPENGKYIESLIHGGSHEHGLRAGTENVPGIAGFAMAAKIAHDSLKDEAQRQIKLRDKIIRWILENIPGSQLNGHPQRRLPNNINISFNGIEGRAMLLDLDIDNIAVSTGSACSSHNPHGSHVLKAIGLSPNLANGSLRITIGKITTENQVNYFLEKLKEEVQFLKENA